MQINDLPGSNITDAKPAAGVATLPPPKPVCETYC